MSRRTRWSWCCSGAAASRTPPTSGGSCYEKSQFPPSSTDRPVSGIGRGGAQRPLDHRRNVIVVDGSRTARTSLVEQAIAAILQEAAPPLANRVLVQAELGRDRLAWRSVRTSQDDAAPRGQRSGDAAATHLPLQISPL